MYLYGFPWWDGEAEDTNGRIDLIDLGDGCLVESLE